MSIEITLKNIFTRFNYKAYKKIVEYQLCIKYTQLINNINYSIYTIFYGNILSSYLSRVKNPF